MRSDPSNQIIAVSAALGAAGLLACVAALFDVFLPKGSFVGLLAGMFLLGFVVTGVMIGYTWACDKCENVFHGWLSRIRGGEKPHCGSAVKFNAAVSLRPTEPLVAFDVQPLRSDPQYPLSRDRYDLMLHENCSPKDAVKTTMVPAEWHRE